MSAIRQSLTVTALALLFYTMLNLVPMALHGIAEPPSQHDGMSPYTMFERCHPQQFNIPAGGCS
jgi:hypothetical protein